MDRAPLNRRRFLAATVATACWTPGGEAEAQNIAIEVVHPPNPYAALLRHIEPGLDDFPEEKAAAEIAGHLGRLAETKSLPMAPGMVALSPVALSYRNVAAGGVAEAVFNTASRPLESEWKRWVDLRPIHSLRFFVLPENRVRFELTTDGAYHVGHWRMEWSDGKLTAFAPLDEIRTVASEPLFRDITGHAFANAPSFHSQLAKGVPYWRANLDAATGIDVHGHNGVAVGDIDNDGFDDLYVCQPGGLPNRLYRNRGDGTFEDITEASGTGILDPTSSALFADFRNSGLQDLVVLRPDGPLLFVNQGKGKFTLQANAFRFRTTPQGNFTSMAAADYDRDGFLDLYLCSYSFFRDGGQYRYPTPYEDARNGPPNFLFRNELTSTGAFIDSTEAAGMNHNNDRFSLSAAWCDYNGDGWPDLCVANDFGRKNLYRNNKGRFTDVAQEVGADDPGAGMSAAWFDYDGDGQPDLYLSNMWSDAGQRVVAAKNLQPAELWKRHPKGNTLLRNRGDGKFDDVSAAQGVEMGRWAWSSGGFDFNHDELPEIFITAGMLTNDATADLEGFFWRHVAAASGQRDYEDGWNALSQSAHESYSEAGRQPNVYYVRRGGKYHDFSGVSGLDVAADSRAFAVADLDGDGVLELVVKNRLGPQIRVYSNRSTQGRPSIVFRLRGVQSNRDAIGARIEVGRTVKFVEAGSGYLSQHTKMVHVGFNDFRTHRATVTWPGGLQQVFEDLKPGFRYDIEEGNAVPRATAFRAPRDMAASPVRGDDSTTLGDITLLDPVPAPDPSLNAILLRYLYDFRTEAKAPVRLATDSRGMVTAVSFGGRPGPALPFPGFWITRPSRNYTALGAAFFAAGYPEQALRYLELSPKDSRTLIAMGKIHLGAGRNAKAREALEQALQLEPSSGEGWNALGAAYVGENNIRVALEYFEKALTINPRLSSALVNAGQAHAALGRPQQAEELFRRAVEVDPKDAAAANQLGELFARRSNDTEAKTWFQRAIGARRDYAPAINNLAALYRRAGQVDDAIAAYRYGISVAPREEAFYLNLAGIYAATNRADAARSALEQLLQVLPNSARARQALNELR